MRKPGGLRVRIAVLTSEFPSVSETFVLQHVADLVARGHEVDVFPERGPARPGLEHPEVRRHRLLARRHLPPDMPARRLARVLRAARIAVEHRAGRSGSLLRSLNPVAYGRHGTSLALLYRQLPFLRQRPYDVVHCHHGPTGLVAAHLRRLGVLRGRLVTTFHGHDANVAPRRGGRDMYRALFHSADLLLVNSEFLRRRVLALGAPPERLVRHPMGVDVDGFRPGARRVDSELRLASVGRLAEEKGVDVALHAVARLLRRHAGLRYDVVGDGPARPDLERLAAALGIAPRVHFHGALHHGRVREILAGADLFCLPSRVGRDGAEESQGLALAEAQASGLPAVASAIGGIPESLRDGVTGHLVAAGDPGALAERLDALLSCPERRAAMGRAARAFAVRHFDREVLADRLVALYAALPAGTRAWPSLAVRPA